MSLREFFSVADRASAGWAGRAGVGGVDNTQIARLLWPL